MLLVLLQQLLVVSAPMPGDELRSLTSLRPKLVEPRRHHLRKQQFMTSPPSIPALLTFTDQTPPDQKQYAAPIPKKPNLQPIELKLRKGSGREIPSDLSKDRSEVRRNSRKRLRIPLFGSRFAATLSSISLASTIC